MQVTLPRQELQEALAAAVTLASSRTPKPILNCVCLAVDGEAVRLSSTDGEAGLRLGVDALTVKRPGTMVVPAERLLGIVRELPDVEVKLEASEGRAQISGQNSQFRIVAAPPEDFPPVAGFEGDADFVMDGRLLRRMIGLTLYAAAKETSRFAINGVLWEKQGKRLFMVATDGRRLARAGGALRESRSGDFEAIVPARALGVLEKVFVPPRDDDEWLVEVKLTPNQILLRSGDRVLSSTLVEGHFPKYQDVIPKSHDKRVRASREELLGAVRRAALLTTEESRSVRLSFQKDRLIVTSQAPDQGDARVEMAISYDGEPIEIGFNPTFLADALRVLPFEEIFIEMQESFRPGVVSGEDKAEFLYVVMPVSVS
jgi:DNA polymerase-3 subunit beta